MQKLMCAHYPRTLHGVAVYAPVYPCVRRMACLSSLRPQAARERLTGCTSNTYAKEMRQRRPHSRAVECWALWRPLSLAFEFKLTRRRGALAQGSATLQPAVGWPELYPRTLHGVVVYACVYPCVRGDAVPFLNAAADRP